MNLNLTISCDDVNPKPGYRLIGEPAEKWFRSLNEEFGCKFNLFVPSCYHQEYPISQHKSWLKELASFDFVELCFHGHFHMTSDPKRYGECEWFELQDEVEISQRLHNMFWEWDQCGIYPVGWRSPGWLISEQSKRLLENFNYDGHKIEYAAIHYEHNHHFQWNCKTFFGHDGIQQENIEIHNGDMIMFQSHIAGKHNHNVWNEQNYEQLRMSLIHLFENYNITPKLLKECL